MRKFKVFTSTPLYETIEFEGEEEPSLDDLDNFWDTAHSKEYGQPEIIAIEEVEE